MGKCWHTALRILTCRPSHFRAVPVTRTTKRANPRANLAFWGNKSAGEPRDKLTHLDTVAQCTYEWFKLQGQNPHYQSPMRLPKARINSATCMAGRRHREWSGYTVLQTVSAMMSPPGHHIPPTVRRTIGSRSRTNTRVEIDGMYKWSSRASARSARNDTGEGSHSETSNSALRSSRRCAKRP